MTDKFNAEEAKKFLLAKEEEEKRKQEEERLSILQKTIAVLKEKLHGSAVEVFLIGSILQPFCFSSRSDVDIVVKNFHGDRFDLWAFLEKEIGRKVEVIPFETCHFQEFVLKDGLKVI